MKSDDELVFLRYEKSGKTKPMYAVFSEVSVGTKPNLLLFREQLQVRLAELKSRRMNYALTEKVLNEWPMTQAIQFSRDVMLEVGRGTLIERAIDAIVLKYPGWAARTLITFPDGSEAELRPVDGRQVLVIKEFLPVSTVR